jgi:hypothetical protein
MPFSLTLSIFLQLILFFSDFSAYFDYRFENILSFLYCFCLARSVAAEMLVFFIAIFISFKPLFSFFQHCLLTSAPCFVTVFPAPTFYYSSFLLLSLFFLFWAIAQLIRCPLGVCSSSFPRSSLATAFPLSQLCNPTQLHNEILV